VLCYRNERRKKIVVGVKSLCEKGHIVVTSENKINTRIPPILSQQKPLKMSTVSKSPDFEEGTLALMRVYGPAHPDILVRIEKHEKESNEYSVSTSCGVFSKAPLSTLTQCTPDLVEGGRIEVHEETKAKNILIKSAITAIESNCTKISPKSASIVAARALNLPSISLTKFARFLSEYALPVAAESIAEIRNKNILCYCPSIINVSYSELCCFRNTCVLRVVRRSVRTRAKSRLYPQDIVF